MKICCPNCKNLLTKNQKWKCFCGHSFNHFNNIGKCPKCNYIHEFTECLEPSCQKISPHLDWYVGLELNLDNIKHELKLNKDLIKISENNTKSK
jgi:hypothetical protein